MQFLLSSVLILRPLSQSIMGFLKNHLNYKACLFSFLPDTAVASMENFASVLLYLDLMILKVFSKKNNSMIYV